MALPAAGVAPVVIYDGPEWGICTTEPIPDLARFRASGSFLEQPWNLNVPKRW